MKQSTSPLLYAVLVCAGGGVMEMAELFLPFMFVLGQVILCAFPIICVNYEQSRVTSHLTLCP